MCPRPVASFLDEGTTTYTQVSDHHAIYGTTVIPTTWREAVAVLYRLGPGRAWRDRYPHAGPLLTQPIQTELIIDHGPELLRLVGSMKFGHTTASLLIAKLHASSRQNVIARALHEYGRLVRSIYLAATSPAPSCADGSGSSSTKANASTHCAARAVLRSSRTCPASSPR